MAIIFPGEQFPPPHPITEEVSTIDGTVFGSLDKLGYITVNIEIQKNDPSIIFNSLIAGDTDWWMGVVTDEDGNNDDLFALGTGTTPGTAPLFRWDRLGSYYLVANASPISIHLIPADNSLNYTRIGAQVDGTTYILAEWVVRSQTYASVWHLIQYRGNTGVATTRDTLAIASDGNMDVCFGSETKPLASSSSGRAQFATNMYIGPTRTFNYVRSDTTTVMRILGFDGTNDIQVGPTSASSTLSLFAGSATAVASLASGSITLADATNIVVNATTGTKIGTATTQKLGFFNATPIVQVVATTDLGTVLSNLGLRAAGTAYPITTSGAVNLTGGVTIATVALTITDVNIVLGTTTGTKIGTATTQKLSFFNATPIVQPSAYTQTYATADKTIGAYTSDPESVTYTGIDNAQAGTPYAQVVDLEALRAAYETLRVFSEDIGQALNSVIDDLQALGLVA